ncbi:MAG: cyclic lactone autoinducer peptide [Bacilli bacterium]|nr:cyclic lactone autoinducer peptide [Bacilli bacterium]
MKLLAKAAAILGAFVAATSTMGCFIFILDEPEMPESLL